MREHYRNRMYEAEYMMTELSFMGELTVLNLMVNGVILLTFRDAHTSLLFWAWLFSAN